MDLLVENLASISKFLLDPLLVFGLAEGSVSAGLFIHRSAHYAGALTVNSVFVYGTLCDIDLLERVLGRSVDPTSISNGELLEYQVFWANGLNYPVIVQRSGASAAGLFLDGLSQQDLARLDFYEGGFGYYTRQISVNVGAKPQEALVYFPAHQDELGDPWDLNLWQAQWGALAVSAATEFMQSFGTADPKQLVPFFKMMQVRAHSRLLGRSDQRERAERGPLVAEVDVEQHSYAYSKFFALEEYRLRHRTYAGGLSDTVDRAIFVSGDASIVLPYDPIRDRVLLVEQFRMGPFARGEQFPWCLEPIAGRVDVGEQPEAAARREAEEEAGITLIELFHISSSYSSPGSTSEVFHLYLGIADLPDGVEQIGGEVCENEDILSRLFSFEELMQMADKNQLLALPTLTAALWLSRHRTRLRAAAT